MNKEQLINYGTAKLAKEKGFNETCGYYYTEDFQSFKADGVAHRHLYDNDIKTIILPRKINYRRQPHLCSCPTQSLLQKWLREKHNVHVNIEACEAIDPDVEVWYDYVVQNFRGTYIKTNSYFYTFEEALEEGLYEALELIE